MVRFGEEGLTACCQSFALGYEVIPDQAKGSIGDNSSTDVEITSITGTETYGLVGETMLGNMLKGCGEDVLFDGSKGPWRRRVIV